jgi:hypothetical protein
MKLLDVVTLLENIPHCQLYRGQVGTIVEVYETDVFEVEFSDLMGFLKSRTSEKTKN